MAIFFRFLNHVDALLKIPGAKVLFGGDLQKNSKIPACYGSFMPTAVQVQFSFFLFFYFTYLIFNWFRFH